MAVSLHRFINAILSSIFGIRSCADMEQHRPLIAGTFVRIAICMICVSLGIDESGVVVDEANSESYTLERLLKMESRYPQPHTTCHKRNLCPAKNRHVNNSPFLHKTQSLLQLGSAYVSNIAHSCSNERVL